MWTGHANCTRLRFGPGRSRIDVFERCYKRRNHCGYEDRGEDHHDIALASVITHDKFSSL
jgi:hypothetical protein